LKRAVGSNLAYPEKGHTDKPGSAVHKDAIGTWEKGASWCARGWAGENADRSDRVMHPRKSQDAINRLLGKETSELEGSF
jgi:hypothetical protein